MILKIFETMAGLLNGSAYLAIIASFVWGILSVLLSPCHLASIPLVVGFISKQKNQTTRNSFFISLLFSFGILISIALIGIITGLMGKMLGDIGKYGNYFVAAIFVFVGFYLLDIIKFSYNNNQPEFEKKGFFAAFVLGLIFGISLGPCTFAYMAPILGIVFSVASKDLVYAISLLLVYGIGHCLVIVFAGTFSTIVQGYLKWTSQENSKSMIILKKVCGILVVLGGIYLVFKN